jgi:hypothetical protein
MTFKVHSDSEIAIGAIQGIIGQRNSRLRTFTVHSDSGNCNRDHRQM